MIERCGEPGCPRLTSESYCDEHTRSRSGSSGYGSHRWRVFARKQLAGWLCEEPGCFKPARYVHHRDGKGALGPRAYDLANIERLCSVHHGVRERVPR